MKLQIEINEMFPVFHLKPPYEWTKKTLDIPDELYGEYLKLQYEWVKMQKTLGEYYDNIEKRIETSTI